MSKMSLNICMGALVGLGFGLIVGKRKCDQLERERDALELHNQSLEADRESLQMSCDNLRETNKLFTDLLIQGNVNEET